MSEKELFGELPELVGGRRGGGRARVVSPVRDEPSWQIVDVDGLVGPDHPVRAVWAYATAVDLSGLYGAIEAREHRAGRPATDPRLLLALWLHATIEGVGSARALERLCTEHAAYRWLCGGVGVNYHTLADFRVGHGDLLDELLTRSVALLVSEGLVELTSLTQDGVRVRASAGTSSFLRKVKLKALLKEARRRVEQLRRETTDDPDASNRRVAAARARAARDLAARVAAALARMWVLEAERERRAKTNAQKTAKQGEPRASTTDSDARVMKMADGGYRPAYNPQIVSTTRGKVIVAVDIDTTGSDHGWVDPLLEQVDERHGRRPDDHLADGGYTTKDTIEEAWDADTRLWCPPIKNRHGTDPFRPRRGDGPGVANWRQRMASEEGKRIYRRRCEAESVNASLRRRGLTQMLVRGREKVRTVLLWTALAHNFLRGRALRAA